MLFAVLCKGIWLYYFFLVVSLVFREAEQRFLLLFLEKEEYHSIRSFQSDGTVFREAEQRFLLLFLEKEEHNH
jgi:hypothetical protein